MYTVSVTTFTEVMNECISSYLSECVSHFLAPKPKKKPQIEDDPRYLYSKSELVKFYKEFNKRRNPSSPNHQVRVEKIYDEGVFLCYKLYRKFA